MKRVLHFFGLLIVTALIVGCAAYTSSTNKGTVGVDRKQFLILSSAQMNQGAKEAYDQVITTSNQKNALNKDTATLKRLQTIMHRLIPHTKVFRSDAPSWDWEVNLIQSDQLNAWCMPGGKIAFYSGIIEKLQLNDDEIAAIMGHEMSHALREHSREKASRTFATQTTISIASQLLGLGSTVSSLANQVSYVTFSLPNSREAETEADRMGVELSARAGYDPKAAISVWTKMSKVSKSQPFELLSTHPIYETRIADLEKYSKKVEPLYLSSYKNNL